jgi:hypothetical protein
MSSKPRNEPVKVVYVMGAGQSGSTILGVTLGNCADFVYAGEVEEWLVKSGRPPWGGSERTLFWDTVAEQVDGADLFGHETNRLVERSSVVLRIDRWRARHRVLRRYRMVATDLLRAIAQTAGVAHVVDTSHFPLRARELQKTDGIDLYTIFLVRDPHEVIESNLRELSVHEVAERRVRVLTMNANLWLTQLVSVLVFFKLPRHRRLFVRHEDFLADPEGIVRQALDLVGSPAEIPDLTSLSIGNPLEGNRLIRSPTIALRRAPADAMRVRPHRELALLTDLLQLPWRPVLGRLRPAAVPGSSETPAP